MVLPERGEPVLPLFLIILVEIVDGPHPVAAPLLVLSADYQPHLLAFLFSLLFSHSVLELGVLAKCNRSEVESHVINNIIPWEIATTPLST